MADDAVYPCCDGSGKVCPDAALNGNWEASMERGAAVNRSEDADAADDSESEDAPDGKYKLGGKDVNWVAAADELDNNSPKNISSLGACIYLKYSRNLL